MTLPKSVKKIIRRIVYGYYDVKKVYKQVTDPKLSKSYYPEEERKSKLAIWKDLTLWQLKYNEVNRLYFAYGLDRKNSDDSEIVPVIRFNKLRNKLNQHLLLENTNYENESYNYVCLLRDKFIFAQLVTSLGISTPKNIAILTKDDITWLPDLKISPLSSLVESSTYNIDGFCKKLGGILGEGAFRLRISDGKLFIKDAETSLQELRNKLNGQYLLQEKIIQHPKMAELHPSSVNTIRLITFNNRGKVDVFSAAIRIGAKGRSVDNWASGGIVVSIDLNTGKLRGNGLFKPGYGGKVQVHPDTGYELEGFEIPFFKESVQLVSKLHTYLYGIHSVGWDVAVTAEGPTLIEGNDDWDGSIPMALEKNFKSRFLKMYPARQKVKG